MPPQSMYSSEELHLQSDATPNRPNILNLYDGPAILNLYDGPDILNLYDGPDILNLYHGPNILNLYLIPFSTDYICYYSIVFLVGVLGNAMVFMIMSDAKFSHFSYPIYMKCLAVSNLTVLFLHLMYRPEILHSSVSISAFGGVYYFFIMLCPWFLVGLSMDQCFCVRFPLRREKFCTRPKAFAFCGGLTVVCLLLIVGGILKLWIPNKLCIGSSEKIIILIARLLSTFFPCLIICFLNITMIQTIKRGRRFRVYFIPREVRQEKSLMPLSLITIIVSVTLLPLSVIDCYTLISILNNREESMTYVFEIRQTIYLVYLLNFAKDFFILVVTSEEYRRVAAKKLRYIKTDVRKDGEKDKDIVTVSQSYRLDIPTRANSR